MRALRFFSLLCFTFVSTLLTAQQVWTRALGGSDAETLAAMTSDGNGGLYALGTFTGNTSLGTYNLTSNGKGDVFIVKLNADNGSVLWVRQVGSLGEDNAYSINCDANGDVFCTGRFSGNVSFGNTILTSSGAFDAFVMKLDAATGLVGWVKQIGGTGGDAGLSISSDTFGNVFTCGYFQGAIAVGTTTLHPIGSNLNAYLVKMDAANGNFIWAKSFGSSGYTYPTALTCDASGDAYITGQFESEITLGASTITAVKYQDMFVTKHSGADGSPVWAVSAGGAGVDVANAIMINNGDLYVSGRYEDSVMFQSDTLVAEGNADAFVSRLSVTSGQFQWTRSLGGDGFEQINAMTHDVAGNILAIGQFNGLAYFGQQSLLSIGNADGFAVRLEPLAGAVTWLMDLGGAGTDSGNGICSDATNALYCAGNFQSSLTLGTNTLVAAGLNDMFLLRVNALTLGINETGFADQSFRAFPNPFNETLTIISDNRDGNLTVNDSFGRVLLEWRITEKNTVLDLRSLPAGIYFLRRTNEQGSQVQKLIKTQ